MLRERSRRRRLSVRTGVTLVATLAAAAVLTLASVLLVTFQLDAALDNLDEMLSDEAEAIAVSIQTAARPPTLHDDDRVLLVYDPDGELIMSAGRFEALVGQTIEAADDQGVDVVFAGETHRVVAEYYTMPDGRTGEVLVAEPRDELDDSVAHLIDLLLLIVPVAVGALGVIVWFVVGRTLRPVEEIRAEVASIGMTDLHHRVPVPPGDDAVARLAGTMNLMLERLERSVRQQQRFVADASHELRTPLTRMRAQLELAERHPSATESAAARRAQLRELRGLQVMLDDLLLLARGDMGVPLGPRELIDLDDLVLEELDSARTVLRVDASAVSAAQVVGVRTALRRCVSNLLDNAVLHAESKVIVTLQESAGEAVLTVDDDGPGIPLARRAEAFERFVRLDGHTEPDHHGLGLAIVAEIVKAHDGSIDIYDSAEGGARVRIRLPLASTERQADARDIRTPALN